MKHNLMFNSLLLLALAPAVFASTTWYVNGVSGNNHNNCKSPATACKTIGHAISLATSGDTIRVAGATYQENLTIGISLTIIGFSAQTTIIDGGSVNTVVTISNGQVTLSNLTIRNGYAQNGGGIYNEGTLTINNTTVSGNSTFATCGRLSCTGGSGGGILVLGPTTINNSTISGNSASYGGGGGITARWTTTINNSTVSGNSAASSGGGIYNSGMLTINNTTVSGNSAFGGCGVIDCLSEGSGGGILVLGATTINNSTISGNSAHNHPRGGGIGIFPHGSATLQNSIVANSIGGGNCYGTMTSNGYNMSSDGTCNFSNSGDRNNTNPVLGTLGNYGGPTQTIPLLPGSSAIDAGNPSGCTDGSGNLLTTDQRGYPRHDPQDTGGCDMGAYERQTD